MQFGNGEYRRSVSLSDIVDRERIRANLNDGVLELYLPRVEKTQPKRIEITSG
jgi:HSP20 family molecular chaperone IbpA